MTSVEVPPTASVTVTVMALSPATRVTADADQETVPRAVPEAPLAARRELSRHDHAEARLREDGGAVREEAPCAVRIERQRLGLRLGEGAGDRREQPRGSSERLEQRLLRVAKRASELLEVPLLRLPHLGRVDEQARIVGRLEEKPEHERIAIARRDLEPEACPQPIAPAEGLALDFQPFTAGSAWGPAWGTTWFRLRGEVPAEWGGKKVEALIDLGFDINMPGFQCEALVYRPDGKGFAWGAGVIGVEKGGGELREYDLGTGKDRSLASFEDGVASVAVQPGGTLLASASLKVDYLATLRGAKADIVNLRSGEVRLHDLATGEQLGPFPGHSAVAFNHSGSRCVWPGNDPALQVLDTKTRRVTRSLPTDPKDTTFAVAFAGESTVVAVVGRLDRDPKTNASLVRMAVRLWDLDAGGKSRVLVDGMTPIMGICTDPEGAHLTWLELLKQREDREALLALRARAEMRGELDSLVSLLGRLAVLSQEDRADGDEDDVPVPWSDGAKPEDAGGEENGRCHGEHDDSGDDHLDSSVVIPALLPHGRCHTRLERGKPRRIGRTIVLDPVAEARETLRP